jgi:glycerol-3-phosphate O-acyltransferase
MVHLRFAEPVMLRPFLDELGVVKGSGNVRTVAPKVAFEVSNRINSVTPVTAPAVLTLVLLDDAERALTEPEMRLGAIPLAEYMAARKLPISSGLYLDQVPVLHERTPSEGTRALETLVTEGVVKRYDDGLEPVYRIPPDRYLEAAFYRNTVSHFFVTRSIVELALVAVAEEGPTALTAAAWTEALALRDLLKFEFFFSTKQQFDVEVRLELGLMDRSWQEVEASADPKVVLERLRQLPFRAAPRILSPFLEAYSVLAERLAAHDSAAPVDEDALVSESISLGRQRVRQQLLHSPESVSKDLFKNALSLAANRGLLETGAEDLVLRRSAFAAELRQAVRRVGVIRSMGPAFNDEEK